MGLWYVSPRYDKCQKFGLKFKLFLQGMCYLTLSKVKLEWDWNLVSLYPVFCSVKNFLACWNKVLNPCWDFHGILRISFNPCWDFLGILRPTFEPLSRLSMLSKTKFWIAIKNSSPCQNQVLSPCLDIIGISNQVLNCCQESMGMLKPSFESLSRPSWSGFALPSRISCLVEIKFWVPVETFSAFQDQVLSPC